MSPVTVAASVSFRRLPFAHVRTAGEPDGQIACISLDRDDEIKGSPGHLTSADGDHPGALIAGRHTDPALMRMGREKPEGTAGCSLIAQQRMYGIDRLDDLKVAIGARMIIRP